MTAFQALFLAFVQGITEFLPISSSGHLALFQKLFQLKEQPVFFDVLLHLGTLMAIIFFFRREIISLIKDWKKQKNFWFLLIVGTLPAAVFGFLLNSKIEVIFNSIKLIGIMWVAFGLLLLFSRRFDNIGTKKIREMKWFDALIIGIFQAVALFPGISRSGSTIIGGKIRKLSGSDAFTFSFLLAIPAILGATVLKIKDGIGFVNPFVGIMSILLSGIVGFISLKLLQRSLNSDKFYLLGYYLLFLGFLTIFFLS